MAILPVTTPWAGNFNSTATNANAGPLDAKVLFDNLDDVMGIPWPHRFQGMRFIILNPPDSNEPKEYWFPFNPQLNITEEGQTVTNRNRLPVIYLPDAIEGKDWQPEIDQAKSEAIETSASDIRSEDVA